MLDAIFVVDHEPRQDRLAIIRLGACSDRLHEAVEMAGITIRNLDEGIKSQLRVRLRITTV